MRAKEFIVEANPAGKMGDDFKKSHQGSMKFRDVGGYDRIYHLHRIMMATAMANGSKDKLPVDGASWYEKYNVAFPYTDVEHLMMLQAMSAIPTDGEELEKRSKSEKLDDTNKQSIVPDRNKLSEAGTMGATTTAAIPTVINPGTTNVGKNRAAGSPGKMAKHGPKQPKPKMQKPTDNALNMKGSIFGSNIKR